MRYALPALLSFLVATIGGCASAEDDGPAGVDTVQLAGDTSADVLPLAGPCEPCTNDRYCDDGLACDHFSWVCKTPAQITASETRMGGWKFCDQDCRKAQVCNLYGQCTPDKQGQHCIVTDEADCKASQDCELNGACFLVGDECKKVPVP